MENKEKINLTKQEVLDLFTETGLKPQKLNMIDIVNGTVCGCLVGAMYVKENKVNLEEVKNYDKNKLDCLSHEVWEWAKKFEKDDFWDSMGAFDCPNLTCFKKPEISEAASILFS